MTKDGNSQKVPGGEHGAWHVFDPESWSRERKEATVLYADLEEKPQPAFAPGMTLQQSLAAAQNPQAQQQQQSAVAQLPPAQTQQRFGTMAITM